ncbi:MAG: MFS transporter [bacterium]
MLGKYLEAFSPLRLRNYRLWFIGQMFSLTGSWMQIIALNWLVYILTNSPKSLGFMSLLTFFISIPVALLGGSLADRYPKRNLIMTTQAIMIFPPILVSILIWTGAVKVWEVILLAVISEAVQGLTMPIIQSFIIEITGRDELPRAIPLNSMMFNLARMVGPALSGIIIAKYNIALAFFFNGISFIFVVVALMLMKVNSTNHTAPPIIAHLRDAFGYALKNKTILIILSLLFVSSTFALSTTTIIPVFAKDIFNSGPKGYGFFMSLLSLGAILGGILTAFLSNKVKRNMLLILGGVAYPLMLFLFSFMKSYHMALFLFALSGLFYVSQFSTMNTIIQLETPDERRGRVMSLYTTIFNSSMRIGGFVAGYLASYTGAPMALRLMALIPIIYIVFVATKISDNTCDKVR